MKVINGNVEYRETKGDNMEEVQNITHKLTKEESDVIQKIGTDFRRLSLGSPEFTALGQPASTDAAVYAVTILEDGKESRVTCWIPEQDQERNECQKLFDVLRFELNEMLDVSIY